MASRLTALEWRQNSEGEREGGEESQIDLKLSHYSLYIYNIYTLSRSLSSRVDANENAGSGRNGRKQC